MPDIDLAAIKARADADEDRTREARLYGDMPALLAEVERLQQAIRDLAEDGGNKAAEYWLRAHQAEQERDLAEQEVERQKAEAWDEGFAAGRKPPLLFWGDPDNPYREQS